VTNTCMLFLSYFKPDKVVVSVSRLRSVRRGTMGSIPSRDESVCLPFCDQVLFCTPLILLSGQHRRSVPCVKVVSP
jgi:hypothetical protein